MKEQLEEKYAIKIKKEENKYYIYNYFGRLISVENTLKEVEEKVIEYYKRIDDNAKRIEEAQNGSN